MLNPIFPRLSAVASLLIGVALGLLGHRNEAPLDPAQSPGGSAHLGGMPSPHASHSNPPPTVSSDRASNLASSAAYSAAWDSLHDGKLRYEDRKRLQAALLREWCAVDLASAIHAVLAEQDESSASFSVGSFDINLLHVCSDEIASQPEFVWNLIQKREFGLSTTRLRRTWVTAVGKQTPVFLLEKYQELPKELSSTAFISLPETMGETVAKFLDREEPKLRNELVRDYARFLRGIGPDRRIVRLEGFPPELRAEVELLVETIEW